MSYNLNISRSVWSRRNKPSKTAGRFSLLLLASWRSSSMIQIALEARSFTKFSTSLCKAQAFSLSMLFLIKSALSLIIAAFWEAPSCCSLHAALSIFSSWPAQRSSNHSCLGPLNLHAGYVAWRTTGTSPGGITEQRLQENTALWSGFITGKMLAVITVQQSSSSGLAPDVGTSLQTNMIKDKKLFITLFIRNITWKLRNPPQHNMESCCFQWNMVKDGERMTPASLKSMLSFM